MQRRDKNHPQAENKCSLPDFLAIVKKYKKKKNDNPQDVLDAYVAMGGGEDGNGCVDADKLIATIRDEIGLTIDIENLIKEIDEDDSGEIEFGEFQQLLESEADNPEIRNFRKWFEFA